MLELNGKPSQLWPMPLAQVCTCYNVRWTQQMALFCKVYLYPIF